MPKPPPTGEKRTVFKSTSTRRPRDREHLTPKEVGRLIEAARKGRWGLRDSTLLLMLFSHGLRLVEALRLRWNHLDLDQGVLHLRRLKNGLDGDHRLRGIEIRSLRRLRRENIHPAGDYVFTSECGSPLGSRAVQLMLDRAASSKPCSANGNRCSRSAIIATPTG
jgi:type 1 fimbriae regulatory protein FimE